MPADKQVKLMLVGAFVPLVNACMHSRAGWYVCREREGVMGGIKNSHVGIGDVPRDDVYPNSWC